MVKFVKEEALSTSQLGALLGFMPSVRFLRECGLSPIAEIFPGTYWRKSDYPIICHAIAQHMIKKAATPLL